MYLHVWNVPAEKWDTRNIGIVSDSADVMDDTDVRMRVFGAGPYIDTPRKAYAEELEYTVHEIKPGMEIYAEGYDRASIVVSGEHIEET